MAGTQGQAGVPWPHLCQVCRVERRRTVRRRGQPVCTVEVSYGITSCPTETAAPLRGFRGHWGIEHRLHWVRDVTFDEDRSQGRAGQAPLVMAACRNLALTFLRRAGHPTIAAALRPCAGRPLAAIALVLGQTSS
jgi:predicted transposase YbfD/YdcC